MKLDSWKVREIIDYANAGQLDQLTGVLVRLSDSELAELKALAWLGKDNDSPRHWDALVIEARAKLDNETTRHMADEGMMLGQNLSTGLAALEYAGRA